MNCYRCNADIKNYRRSDTCPQCGYDTRTCKNCVHYNPNAYNECQESQAERVLDKEKGNFCDWFRPGQNEKAASSERAALKKAAEELFKKP